MKQYRLAVVGLGNSVNNHLNAIQSLGDRVKLVAVVDPKEAHVKAYSEQLGAAGYLTADDMLSAEKPDLVCIVTPPATHKDISLACLGAGAWVYCEKPLCASLADFDTITAAEERTGCYVNTVFQWRFGSASKRLKQLIEDQTFGRPLLGICHTLWYRGQDYYDVPWRGKYETEFGGPTLNLGIHLMDMFLWLMGDWQYVQATVDTLARKIEVEDLSMAMVRFDNGAMASIVNSVLSPRQESYMRLDFEKATLEVSALYRHSNDNWRITLPPNVDDPGLVSRWQDNPDNFSGSHDVQLADMLNSMDQGIRPSVSGTEARRILEFTTSLYKSAFTGQRVHRGDITPDDPFYHGITSQLAQVALRS